MIRLTEIFVAVGVAFIAMVLTACPYIDHGSSKAAELVSLDEVQGCFFGTTLNDWGDQKKMYCYKLCMFEDRALISRKIQYVTQTLDGSLELNSVEEDTTFSKSYTLNETYDKDGSLLYSISIDDFDKMSYRDGAFFGTGRIANFSRTEEELCAF